MSMMDSMKNKVGGMGDMSKDQMQARMRELSDMEKHGELSDKGREELNMLRKKM